MSNSVGPDFFFFFIMMAPWICPLKAGELGDGLG